MYFFLLIFLPLVLTAYCFYVRNKTIAPVIFIGIMSSVIFCGFKMLFMYSHRVVPYSFIENLFYFLVKQTLLPCAVLYGLYFLVTKDDEEYKVNAVFPLLISFYIVFLPYTELTADSKKYTWFALFFKPFIILSMIVLLACCARFIYKAVKSSLRPQLVKGILFAVFALVMPAVIESFYIIHTEIFIVIILAVLYILLSLFVLRKCYKENLNA